ncbi:hypothetical protein KJ596_04095 [Patescibacteria group bacterium]|nr:hypothetical protein [Patescibacteria group bacterium]MBU1868767.1 hypothetical protein [Patescibacteria group bacterium]
MYKVILTVSGIYPPNQEGIGNVLNILLPIGSWRWVDNPTWPTWRRPSGATDEVKVAAYLTPREVVNTLPFVMACLGDYPACEGRIVSLTEWEDRRCPSKVFTSDTLPALLAMIQRKLHRYYNLEFTPVFAGDGFECEVRGRVDMPEHQCSIVSFAGVEEAQSQPVAVRIRRRGRVVDFAADFFVKLEEIETRRLDLDTQCLNTILSLLTKSPEGARVVEFGWLGSAWQRRRILSATGFRVAWNIDKVLVSFPGKRKPRHVTFDRYELQAALGCVLRSYTIPDSTEVWVRKDIGGWVVSRQHMYLQAEGSAVLRWGGFDTAIQFSEIYDAVECLEANSPPDSPFQIRLEATQRDVGRPANGLLWRRCLVWVENRGPNVASDWQHLVVPVRGGARNAMTANLSFLGPDHICEFRVEWPEIF